jgi:hypothetical protein
MSDAQRSALTALSPIVLDLDGNGVSTLSAAEGVQFDLAASGQTGQYGWVGGNDGLLVRDVNLDGVINDGRELFGAATQLGNGTAAGNGYAALADLDGNHDSKISATDASFGELKVWVDANHDGKTDLGELKGLVDLGITALDLNYLHSDRQDQGNAVALVSGYETTDGQTHEMADVWFAQARSETPPPQIADLLAEAPAELALPAGPGSTTPVPAAADAVTTVAAVGVTQHGNPFEEELLRHQTLI